MIVLPKSKCLVLAEVPELRLVEEKLSEILGRANGVILESCTNLLCSGGKRLRPLLTLSSGLCVGKLNDDIICAAVAAELIHMASLVHDDVIDGSLTRRGRDTINARHGNCAAVLTGDYMFAEAFSLLASRRLLSGMGYLVEAIKEMCSGEVNQAQELFQTGVNTAQYFSRIGKKTAVLLAACCKSGAAAAGAREDEILSLGEYGLNLGYAYQIVDDILDFTGSPEKLGKPIGVDVSSGNVTLPVILLLENPVYAGWIKEVLRARQIPASGVESIKEALINAGLIEKSYHTATFYVEKAKACLKLISEGPHTELLCSLADQILQRDA